MPAYVIGPSYTAAGVVTEVATGTALRTVLQLATPSTTSAQIIGWGISFKGVAAADSPILVQLMATDTGMSAATSLTPTAWDVPAATSLCVGGTGATAVADASVTETTITASRLLDAQEIHPQTGYSVIWDRADWPTIQRSYFCRIRVTASVDVSCLPWLRYFEPAQ